MAKVRPLRRRLGALALVFFAPAGLLQADDEVAHLADFLLSFFF